MQSSRLKPKTLVGILNFYLGLGLVIMTLFLSISGYYFISHILEDALKQKANALAEQVATVTIDAVMLQEYSVIERMANDLVQQNPDLISILITNKDHQVLADVTQTRLKNQAGLVIQHPLMFYNTPSGNITLSFSKASIKTPLNQLSIGVFIALLIMLGSLMFAVQKLLSHHLISPIQDLSLALNSIQKVFNETIELKENLPAELNVLSHAVKDLQQALHQHIKSLEEAHQFTEKATQNLCQSQRLVAIGQLAAGLAHNLNTPLANIIGYAQMAALQTEDEALHKRLSTIERQAKTCSESVKNLLSASKPPELAPNKLDLVPFIEKIIQIMSPVVRQQAGIKLSFSHPQQAMSLVDSAALEQILFNLITNSVDADATSITLQLKTCTDAPKHWCLLVTDNGQGIPVEQQTKVFEAFFTTKAEQSDSTSGTGLGLFLSKTLLNQMQGDISVVESDAHGTQFLIQVLNNE